MTTTQTPKASAKRTPKPKPEPTQTEGFVPTFARMPGEKVIAYRARVGSDVRTHLDKATEHEGLAGIGLVDIHATFTKADGKPDGEKYVAWCAANLRIQKAYAYRLLTVGRLLRRHPDAVKVSDRVTGLEALAKASDEDCERIIASQVRKGTKAKPMTADDIAYVVAKASPDGDKASKATKASKPDRRMTEATKATVAGIRRANTAAVAVIAKASGMTDADKASVLSAVQVAFEAGYKAGAKAGALADKALPAARAEMKASQAEARARATENRTK